MCSSSRTVSGEVWFVWANLIVVSSRFAPIRGDIDRPAGSCKRVGSYTRTSAGAHETIWLDLRRTLRRAVSASDRTTQISTTVAIKQLIIGAGVRATQAPPEPLGRANDPLAAAGAVQSGARPAPRRASTPGRGVVSGPPRLLIAAAAAAVVGGTFRGARVRTRGVRNFEFTSAAARTRRLSVPPVRPMTT